MGKAASSPNKPTRVIKESLSLFVGVVVVGWRSCFVRDPASDLKLEGGGGALEGKEQSDCNGEGQGKCWIDCGVLAGRPAR